MKFQKRKNRGLVLSQFMRIKFSLKLLHLPYNSMREIDSHIWMSGESLRESILWFLSIVRPWKIIPANCVIFKQHSSLMQNLLLSSSIMIWTYNLLCNYMNNASKVTQNTFFLYDDTLLYESWKCKIHCLFLSRHNPPPKKKSNNFHTHCTKESFQQTTRMIYWCITAIVQCHIQISAYKHFYDIILLSLYTAVKMRKFTIHKMLIHKMLTPQKILHIKKKQTNKQ